jgi:hypothetical protein
VGVGVHFGEAGLGVEIGADEGVAALDVVAEVGEDALVDELALDALGGLAFEDFEEEGELGDFHGLAIDVTPKTWASRMRLRSAVVSAHPPPRAWTSTGDLPLASFSGSWEI